MVWVGLARGARRQGDRRTCCSWIRCIATPPARPASPMSMSGTVSSTKPAASCSRAPTSKARSANCVPMTACISPSPARASSRIMSSARSRGCWRRAPRRSRCRPNRQRPTPMRCPASRRRVRWQDRSCRWWRPPSAPINCSAAPDRARPRSMRSPRARWSRASRWRRPPAAPMISSGRAAKSDANRPRAKRRWPRSRPMGRSRRRLPRPPHRRSRRKLRPIQSGTPSIRDFFGFGNAQRPPQPAQPQPQGPRPPPRPPGNVGRGRFGAGLFHAVIFQSSFQGARSVNPESRNDYLRFRVCAGARPGMTLARGCDQP